MTHDIVTSSIETTSPFDAMKHTRADGSEYWSARELAPKLGYHEWRKFQSVVRKVEDAFTVAGIALTSQIAHVGHLVERPQGGTVQVTDYELTRFAAYRVVLASDDGKRAVSDCI